MTSAEMKVAAAVRLTQTFPVIPSWMSEMSVVMRVVVSPAHNVSKNDMFWRMIVFRYVVLKV